MGLRLCNWGQWQYWKDLFESNWVALKRAVLCFYIRQKYLLAAGVLGDGLCAFTDSVLGEFTGQKETDSSLDLSACDGGSLVVVSQSGCFSSDSLEDIVDKAVHDGHSFAWNTSVWVHLSQHLVDVDRVGFPPLPPAFLVATTSGLCLGGGLFRSLACNTFSWHDYSVKSMWFASLRVYLC